MSISGLGPVGRIDAASNALRARLERKLLFGKRRTDKFSATR